MSISLDLAPQPGMQVEALQCPADEMFLGGQAGPGKSWFLLYADIEDAIKHPAMRVLFLRRQMPELADLLEKAMAMYLPLGATFIKQHSLYLRPAFVFPQYKWSVNSDGVLENIEIIPKTQGAIFVFGHMSHETDKYAYGGFEWTRINWDELPNFLETQYTFMWSRVRTAVKGLRTRMRATGNPVGIGMLWVKRRFIDPMPAREIRSFVKVGNKDIEVPIGTPRSKTRCFIPGIRSQNTYLGEDYEGNLAQLDPRMYNALALGKWEVEDVPGQLISGKWLDHALSGKVKPLEDPVLMQIPAVAFDYATDRGSDSSVLMKGRGNRPLSIQAWPYTTQSDAAYLVSDAADQYGIHVCKVGVDGNGPGVGVCERLEEGAKEVILTLPDKKGWHVEIKKIPRLERCCETDKGYSQQWKAMRRLNFPNFRSQMYWKLKDDLEHGRVDLSYLLLDKGSSQYLEKLQEELLSITYEERAGLIFIIKKEDLRHPDRLGRSPDFADTLAIWNWVRERTRETYKRRNEIDEETWGDTEALEEKYARAHF